MKAKNKVIAGEYKNRTVGGAVGKIYIITGFLKQVDLNSEMVESYELLNDDHNKSAVSGAMKGLVGGAVLGNAGTLAGAMSAKTKGIYTVSILFKDGKKSLIEIDDKLYKFLLQSCF